MGFTTDWNPSSSATTEQAPAGTSANRNCPSSFETSLRGSMPAHVSDTVTPGTTAGCPSGGPHQHEQDADSAPKKQAHPPDERERNAGGRAETESIGKHGSARLVDAQPHGQHLEHDRESAAHRLEYKRGGQGDMLRRDE